MMEEAGPHHYAAGPHQVDANLHQAKSRGSQHGNPHRSPEWREGHQGSVCTTHTTKSRSRGKSHVSHAKNDKNLQREIDELKRELHHARRKRELKSLTRLVIGGDLELRLVRLFPMKRSTAIDIGTKARLAGAWGTTP